MSPRINEYKYKNRSIIGAPNSKASQYGQKIGRTLKNPYTLAYNLPFNRLIYCSTRLRPQSSKLISTPFDTGYQPKEETNIRVRVSTSHAGIIVLRLSPFAISIAA